MWCAWVFVLQISVTRDREWHVLHVYTIYCMYPPRVFILFVFILITNLLNLTILYFLFFFFSLSLLLKKTHFFSYSFFPLQFMLEFFFAENWIHFGHVTMTSEKQRRWVPGYLYVGFTYPTTYTCFFFFLPEIGTCFL